jgi:hypothetical protein
MLKNKNYILKISLNRYQKNFMLIVKFMILENLNDFYKGSMEYNVMKYKIK